MVIEISTGGQPADITPSSGAQEHLTADNQSGELNTIVRDTEVQQGSSRHTGAFFKYFFLS
jgi:hypothetical protein